MDIKKSQSHVKEFRTVHISLRITVSGVSKLQRNYGNASSISFHDFVKGFNTHKIASKETRHICTVDKLPQYNRDQTDKAQTKT